MTAPELGSPLTDLLLQDAPLDAAQVDRLRRCCRDPRPAVWEDSCRLLGDRAHGEPAAYFVLQELLHSPLPELRLRGVSALAGLAPHRPDEVLQVVDEVLAAADQQPDPVLLLAALSLLVEVPADMGRSRLLECLADAREAVRAAAVSSLPAWTSWPADVVAHLAHDPSALVRGSLAVVLPGAPADVDAATLWDVLAGAREAWFRAFVAEELRAVGGEAGHAVLERLAGDEQESVRIAARGEGVFEDARPTEAGFGTLQALEASLDAAPERALETLQEVVNGPRPLPVLDSLSHLARDASVAAVCRGLVTLLTPSPVPPADLLAAVVDVLGDSMEESAAASFKRFVSQSLRGLEVRSLEDAVAWATFVDLDLGPCATGDAVRGLSYLAELAGSFTRGGTADALLAVEDAAHAIPGAFVLPERKVVLSVVEAWGELIEGEIEEAIAGVES